MRFFIFISHSNIRLSCTICKRLLRNPCAILTCGYARIRFLFGGTFPKLFICSPTSTQLSRKLEKQRKSRFCRIHSGRFPANHLPIFHSSPKQWLQCFQKRLQGKPYVDKACSDLRTSEHSTLYLTVRTSKTYTHPVPNRNGQKPCRRHCAVVWCLEV